MMLLEPRRSTLEEDRSKYGSLSRHSALSLPLLIFPDCRLEEGLDVPDPNKDEPDGSGGTRGPLLPPGEEDGPNETRTG